VKFGLLAKQLYGCGLSMISFEFRVSSCTWSEQITLQARLCPG